VAEIRWLRRDPAALAAMRAASAGLSRPRAADDIARVLAGLAARLDGPDRPAREGGEAPPERSQDLLGVVTGDQAARRYRPGQQNLGTAPAER
jgi:hypothetical protein